MQNLAVVFPGQGSQQIGMLAELANKFPQIENTFAIASEVLGYDLWQVCQQGPAEKLNQTQCTQPALLTAGYAVWQVWCETQAERPKMLAGHSLGEYTALVCAQALDFTTAVKLVAQRGEFMQQAVSPGVGSMAAIIGLDPAQVETICAQAAQTECVCAANYNSIGQIVIAGDTAAVERASELAKAQGARKVVTLAVSVPSHCALMQPAAEKLADTLNSITFNNPKTPVINNVNASPCADPEQIKQHLIAQLSAPVRWVETIQYMAAAGITQIDECGPGKILSGLNRRIDKTLTYQQTAAKLLA